MSKDGAGGGSYSTSCGGSCKCKPQESTTSNVHVATLAIIDRELARLHQTLREGNGDDDVTQDQINNLHEQLIDLSERLTDV